MPNFILIALIIGASLVGGVSLTLMLINPSPDARVSIPIIVFVILIVAGVAAKGKLRYLAFACLGALLIPFSILGIASFGFVTLLYGLGILGFCLFKLFSRTVA